MPIRCTLLVHDNRSMVVPLYTIEEDVKTSEEPFSDQCRATVGNVIGEHGTATILLVLDNATVIAAASRISSFTDWIVKPHQFKVRKIRENPASVACYSGNIAGAEKMLDHLEDKGKKTRSHKSLIRAASKFMKKNVPWESFGCHLASIDPKPMAHLVVHDAEPQHVADCLWEANWNKCKCWDIDSMSKDRYCERRTQGVCLGSGGSAACNYVASKHKWIGLKIDKSHPNELKMVGKLSMSADEARNDAFAALLAAAFDDPSTGGPFKAYIMRQGETEVEEKTCDFLEACESYYEEVIKKYEDNSIFVVYPYHMQQSDCGKVVTDQFVKEVNTVNYLGHPLTWLRGRYTLQCITFNERKHAVEAYLRGEQVEGLPSFTRSTDGVRRIDVESQPKKRKRRGLISHTMYVAMVSVEFVRALIGDLELMKTV